MYSERDKNNNILRLLEEITRAGSCLRVENGLRKKKIMTNINNTLYNYLSCHEKRELN